MDAQNQGIGGQSEENICQPKQPLPGTGSQKCPDDQGNAAVTATPSRDGVK